MKSNKQSPQNAAMKAKTIENEEKGGGVRKIQLPNLPQQNNTIDYKNKEDRKNNGSNPRNASPSTTTTTTIHTR